MAALVLAAPDLRPKTRDLRPKTQDPRPETCLVFIMIMIRICE